MENNNNNNNSNNYNNNNNSNDQNTSNDDGGGKPSGSAVKFDAQDYIGITEDDIVDYDTAEEYLLHFARVGQLMFVKKLILLKQNHEIELDIDCKGETKANFGWTPMQLASYFGHCNVVEILIQAGANIDIQNEEGDTALHKASYTGREEIVTLLVANNANVFLLNGDGLRAFELAKTESIRRVLAAAEQADIHKREGRFLSAARNGDIPTMKKLLEDTCSPVDINCVDSSGNTALHCAAYRGQNEAVLFLLKNGIDTGIKNNRSQLAANVASTVSLKQIIQEVHLSTITPQMVATLKSRTVSRFEGPLLRKNRFFGFKFIWAVLERGVFSFFSNRADAANGIRRQGYRYLESAITETIDIENSEFKLMFVIIFGDRSKAIFAIPKNQTELDLQKWLNAINDHIYFSTNFIKQGTHIEDSDDEDEATKLLPMSSVQDMILTAGAHQKILEKHIKGLQNLLDDETAFAENSSEIEAAGFETTPISSIVPSIKFHLNLILESSKNASDSLTQCLRVISHQNDARQKVIRQEQDKVRVLEETLQALARQHHDLERSIVVAASQQQTQQQQQQQPNQGRLNNLNKSPSQNISHAQSLSQYHRKNLLEDATNSLMSSHRQLSFSSRACLSDSATDIDEYYDAFDDGQDFFDGIDQASSSEKFDDHSPGGEIVLERPPNATYDVGSSFHTCLQGDSTTINDSIPTLDNDSTDATGDDDDRTLASDLDLAFFRETLPAKMVPRDEVGLWSILKHCIGKELSKITIPVIFNEPISFLQRLTEMLHYSEFLNVADQSIESVEAIENVCAFIISATSYNYLRLNKPFNPMLGETFELYIPETETRIVLEQVSHHPPISVWHAESPHFIFRGSMNPKLRFWGKSIEVRPEGSLIVELKNRGEVYTWNSINCCVHNIIVGRIWFEQYGTLTVKQRQINEPSTESANKASPDTVSVLELNFKSAGWFGHDLNRFDGFIFDSKKNKLRFLYGKWNDYLKSAPIEEYEQFQRNNKQKFRAPEYSGPAENNGKVQPGNGSKTQTGNDDDETSAGDNGQASSVQGSEASSGDMPKSDSAHSLHIPCSRILWKAAPRPNDSEAYYNFNAFTFRLNDPGAIDPAFRKILPPTDSRYRPDVRKLEEGDLDGAAEEKHRLEEKQREARKTSKKNKTSEHQPLWFERTFDPKTGEQQWVFLATKYLNRDWSRCPDIF